MTEPSEKARVIWALAYEAYIHTALVLEARTRAASIIQAALDEARREGADGLIVQDGDYVITADRASKQIEALTAERDRYLKALEIIAAIADKSDGGDWCEIDEARAIAREAIKGGE